jgi:hypothetical protein
MSDLENPYKSPESPIVPEKFGEAGISLSETMLRYLKEASPWLRFIGIVGFIGCGFMCLIAIIGIIVALTGLVSADETGGIPLWLITLVYLPIGVLIFFPSRYTYNFGTKIRNYYFSNSDEDLESAFKNNKSLWKFYGILCIIYLAFIPVSIFLGIIGTIAASLTGFLF